MTAIDLIARALPAQSTPDDLQDGICCVTGQSTATVPRKLVIKSSFTNLDCLRAPLSDRAGLAAWRVLNYPPARQSSWICDGVTFRKLTRVDVRGLVLSGVSAEAWAGYITTSHKKHGVLWTPVNQGNRQVWLFETLLVDCTDRVAVADHWQRLRAAQDAGVSRPLMESLEIYPGYIEKVGWRNWTAFERWARPRLQSPLYRLLVYLLPSKEELGAKHGGNH